MTAISSKKWNEFVSKMEKIEDSLQMLEHSISTVTAAATGVQIEVNKLSEVLQLAQGMAELKETLTTYVSKQEKSVAAAISKGKKHARKHARR